MDDKIDALQNPSVTQTDRQTAVTRDPTDGVQQTGDGPYTETDTQTQTATDVNWLLTERRDNGEFGICRLCLRHSTDKGGADPWTNRGVSLEDYRRQKLTRHAESKKQLHSGKDDHAHWFY